MQVEIGHNETFLSCIYRPAHCCQISSVSVINTGVNAMIVSVSDETDDEISPLEESEQAINST